jgi:hypothetical protein
MSRTAQAERIKIKEKNALMFTNIASSNESSSQQISQGSVLGDHPLFDTQVQCINSKRMIPILAGYAPPTLPPRMQMHNKGKVWTNRSKVFAFI